MLPTAIHWVCGRELPEPARYGGRIRSIVDIPFTTPHGTHLTMDVHLPGEPVGPTTASSEGPSPECPHPPQDRRPADTDGAANLPAWVCWFGGGFLGGGPFAMRRVAARIAAAGMPAVAAGYSLGDVPRGVRAWPAAAADAAAVVRMMRGGLPGPAELPVVREGPLVALGFSSGAYLAMMTAFAWPGRMLPADFGGPVDGADDDPRRWAWGRGPEAVVNFSGVTDRRGLSGPSQLSLLGPDGTTDEGLAWRASPLRWVGPTSPPVFTVHGEADNIVAVRHARGLDAALRGAGVAHEMTLLPGVQHDPVSADVLDAAIAWACRVTQPPGTATIPSR